METTTIAAIILALVSIPGVILNVIVLFANKKMTHSKHAFATLTVNQASIDIIGSTVFLAYACPLIFTGSEFLKQFDFVAGYLLLATSEISTQVHLIMSCNRLVAVFIPFKYPKIFSICHTWILIIAISSILLTYTFIVSFIGCPFIWYSEVLLFDYADIEICYVIQYNIQVPKYIFSFASMIILDIITVFRLRQIRKRQSRTALTDTKSLAQRARETSFLKQTCSQTAAFTTEFIAGFYLSPLTDNLWLLFFYLMILWSAVHAIDGLATLYFNQDMRTGLKSFRRKPVTGAENQTGQSDSIFRISSRLR